MTQSAADAGAPRAPFVWRWYRSYCAVMASVLLFCALFGFVILFSDRPWLPVEGVTGSRSGGLLFAGLGTPCCVGFTIGAFVPRKPWGWSYGLVLLCLGVTSICWLPVTLPLLVLWLRKDTRRYFGRGV